MLGMKATKLFLFCGSFQYPETLRNSIVESNITSWSLQRSRLDVGPFNFFLKLEHCNEIKAEPNAPHYFQKQPMMRTLISKTCMEIAPAWISVAILKVLRIWLCVLFILICMFGQIIDIIRQQCFLCNIYSINFRKEINAQ